VSLRRADHSSRGVLPNVVSECDLETSTMRTPKLNRAVCWRIEWTQKRRKEYRQNTE